MLPSILIQEVATDVLDQLPSPIRLAGPDGGCQYLNGAWLAFTGRSLEGEFGRGWLDAVHSEDRTRCWGFFQDALKTRLPFVMEYRLRHQDGTYHWITDQGQPYCDAAGRFQGFISVLHDIDAVRKVERRLLRMKNLYAALSYTNQAISRSRDEDGLFQEICRIAVDFGRFRMAWIGLLDADGRLIVPVARHGQPAQYLKDVPMIVDRDRREGRGPAERAIRTNRHQIVDDLLLDPEVEPWRTPIEQAGFHSTGVFVLRQEQRVAGVLVVYSEEKGFFDQDLVDLLDKMALEISYALDHFAQQARRQDTERRMHRVQSRLQHVLNISPAAIYNLIPDPDDPRRPARVLFVSEAIQDLVGHTPEQWLQDQHFWINYIHPDDQERVLEDMTRLYHQGWIDHEYRFRHQDGGYRWVHDKRVLLRDAAGQPREVVGSWMDISPRKRAEQQQRLWAQVFASSGEAIFVTDAQQRIVLVNQAFVHITGYSEAEVLNQGPERLEQKQGACDTSRGIWQVVRDSGRWQGEVRYRRRTGEGFPAWLSLSRVRNDNGEIIHFVAILKDLSESLAAEQRIQYLAHYDSLTGLPNRNLLRERLSLEIAHTRRRGSGLAVLFLNLDRFKTINDSLGHQQGDRLLQIVARRLGACVRASDTVSRQGGDEFIVLLPDIHGYEDAAHVAEKILQQLALPCKLDSYELIVGVSIGISLLGDDGDDLEVLIKSADLAMYHAKECGRNNFQFFTEKMNVRTLERLTLENHLRQALTRGELSLVYQPQMDLASGLVIGVEALCRWENPSLGRVSPVRFIPIAEESGLIVPIGDWVLETACRQLRAWRKAGLNGLRVAVNLSAGQILRPGLAKRVADILLDTGLEPAALELEITESLLMKDVDLAVETLNAFRRLGVGLAMDDFGTGYSSLAYLKRFPLDRVKIDQSFVRDIVNDPDDAAIALAVIAMAHSLRLKVIAEGVETEKHLEFLRAESCDEIQGYYFSPPLPPEQVAELIQNHDRKGR